MVAGIAIVTVPEARVRAMTIDFTSIGFHGGFGAIVGAAAAVFGGLVAAYFGVRSAANAAERRLLNVMSITLSLVSLATLFLILLSLDKGLPAWLPWALAAVYGTALWRMIAYTRRAAKIARADVDLSFLEGRVPSAIAEAQGAKAETAEGRVSPLSSVAG